MQDRRPDIQPHNPRPNFIGRGIKRRPLSLPDRITYSSYNKCMHIVDCSSNNVPVVDNTSVYTALVIITCVYSLITLDNSEMPLTSSCASRIHTLIRVKIACIRQASLFKYRKVGLLHSTEDCHIIMICGLLYTIIN